MKRFIIEDLFDVAEAMYDEIKNNKKEQVMFIGKYDEAILAVKELIMYDDVIPYDIEICPEEIGLYNKEYYITLDADMNVWCEPAWRKDRYLYSTTDVMFIMNDCNSSILNAIGCYEAIEVAFDYEEKLDECNCACGGECHGTCSGECCDESCCHCKNNNESEVPSDHAVTTRIAVDENGNICGFEKTWNTHEGGMKYFSSYSHYSNNQDMIKYLMENFDMKLK